MRAQELVQSYVEESLADGAEAARLSLCCRRDFISITEDELLVAMARVVAEANNDGGARQWYLLIIAMGLLATALTTTAAITGNVSEVVRYMLGGFSALGLILAWRYFQYIRAFSVHTKKVAAICHELRDALEQLGVMRQK